MKELFTALSKCQSALSGAKKDSENPFFKSKYADLESVWDAIRKPLTDNGLCVIQTTVWREGNIVLITTLGHSSGDMITGEYQVTAKDHSPQAIGSAITYARRYALASIVGAYQTDDDGNTASGNTQPRPQPPKPQALPNQAPTNIASSLSNRHQRPGA